MTPQKLTKKRQMVAEYLAYPQEVMSVCLRLSLRLKLTKKTKKLKSKQSEREKQMKITCQ